MLKLFFPYVLVKEEDLGQGILLPSLTDNVGIRCHLLDLEVSTGAQWFYKYNTYGKKKDYSYKCKNILGKFLPPLPSPHLLPPVCLFAYCNIDCQVSVHQSNLTLRMKRTIFSPFNFCLRPWATSSLLGLCGARWVPLACWGQAYQKHGKGQGCCQVEELCSSVRGGVCWSPSC